MVTAATKDPDYIKVSEIVLNGGEGPWPIGPEGIRKQRAHLSIIDSMVVFWGRSILPMSLRQQVLDSREREV